eukprot:TRINITY_DN2587_c0_g1_i1.p1 TRINITY_DN2587_c0_g1~~TRINITY_DN2587_c0_g1_i1.p1  ORF type:complete len:686 (+),score=192.61 TRINITY_DN2587_c0_g1_i1:63-2120(+)
MDVCARMRRCLLEPLRARMTLDGEAPEEVHRKLYFVMFVAIGLLASAAALANTMLFPFFLTIIRAQVGILSAVLAGVLWTRRLPAAVMAGTMVWCMLAITGMDLYAMGVSTRGWPMFVLIVDFLLVVGAPRRWALAVVVYVCAYVLLSEVERAYRFGLLDLPGMVPYDFRRDLGCCEKPPCRRGELVSLPTYITLPFFVFLMDFMLTRWFQEAAALEQARTAAAVQTAQCMAAHLARFDLDPAREHLQEHGDMLPAELLGSFETLLHNLASYRPYLPQALLPRKWRDGDVRDEVGTDETGGRPLLSPLGSPSFESTIGSPSSVISSPRSSVPMVFPIPRIDSALSGAQKDRSDTSAAGARVRLAADPAPLTANHLATRSVSLLAVTLRPAHDETLEDSAAVREFTGRHEDFLGHVINAVDAARGVVDSFVGYKVLASFNATRPVLSCYAKAAQAVRSLAATLHEAHPGVYYTGALATGPGLAGVLGTTSMRRPCVVGPLVATLQQLERYAVLRGLGVVCNYKQFIETCLTVEMRIRLDRVFLDMESEPTVGGAPLAPLYELMLDGADAATPRGQRRPGPQEWMYELEDAAGKKWEAFNQAGLAYVLHGREAARRCLLAQDAGGRAWELFTAAAEAAATIDFAPSETAGGSVPDRPLPVGLWTMSSPPEAAVPRPAALLPPPFGAS